MAGTVRKAVAGLGTPNETPARTKLPNSAEDRRFESIPLQRGVCELSVPERRTDRRENIVTAAEACRGPRVDRGVLPDRDGGGDRPIDPAASGVWAPRRWRCHHCSSLSRGRVPP